MSDETLRGILSVDMHLTYAPAARAGAAGVLEGADVVVPLLRRGAAGEPQLCLSSLAYRSGGLACIRSRHRLGLGRRSFLLGAAGLGAILGGARGALIALLLLAIFAEINDFAHERQLQPRRPICQKEGGDSKALSSCQTKVNKAIKMKFAKYQIE